MNHGATAFSSGSAAFFDDEMHALLGINDYSWQSLYHFTIGGAIDDARLSTLDARLSTLPPYEFQP